MFGPEDSLQSLESLRKVLLDLKDKHEVSFRQSEVLDFFLSLNVPASESIRVKDFLDLLFCNSPIAFKELMARFDKGGFFFGKERDFCLELLDRQRLQQALAAKKAEEEKQRQRGLAFNRSIVMSENSRIRSFRTESHRRRDDREIPSLAPLPTLLSIQSSKTEKRSAHQNGLVERWQSKNSEFKRFSKGVFGN